MLILWLIIIRSALQVCKVNTKNLWVDEQNHLIGHLKPTNDVELDIFFTRKDFFCFCQVENVALIMIQSLFVFKLFPFNIPYEFDNL